MWPVTLGEQAFHVVHRGPRIDAAAHAAQDQQRRCDEARLAIKRIDESGFVELVRGDHQRLLST